MSSRTNVPRGLAERPPRFDPNAPRLLGSSVRGSTSAGTCAPPARGWGSRPCRPTISEGRSVVAAPTRRRPLAHCARHGSRRLAHGRAGLRPVASGGPTRADCNGSIRSAAPLADLLGKTSTAVRFALYHRCIRWEQNRCSRCTRRTLDPPDFSGKRARGRNRTADTGIFSPLLYRLSYPREPPPVVFPAGRGEGTSRKGAETGAQGAGLSSAPCLHGPRNAAKPPLGPARTVSIRG